MNGYLINGGDLTTMTPLQRYCVTIINNIIWKWKNDNKPFVVL